MQWLDRVVEEIIAKHPTGELLVESGVSPSGTYHVGTLREVLTADAIMLVLRQRGRQAKHIHYVDDLDPLRKVPTNVPADFEQYLGKPYCDIPAPSNTDQSYADFFLDDFLGAARKLKLEMGVIRSHQKYRSGAMTEAIEKALAQADKIGQILAKVSGHKVDENWSPIQIIEGGYLKSRRFEGIDTNVKTIDYLDADGQKQMISYDGGEVKLNWRVDWPARWWLLGVQAEPFGRDHATKGGSYDTGAAIVKEIYGAEPPLPIPYHFINLTGETKKMSKSSGNIIAVSELVEIMPPEVVRYFVLRLPPDKQLFFDQVAGVVRLIDDFAALLAKPAKTASQKQLIELSTNGIEPTVSQVPFSHLVASYQAALKDPDKTLEVLNRSEYHEAVEQQRELIKKELGFIDRWLNKWAPAEVKFALAKKISAADFSTEEKQQLAALADKITEASKDADGEWFHKQIYELAEQFKVEPKAIFTALYKALIGATAGPRAGWFLSILPRDWLLKRLRLEA